MSKFKLKGSKKMEKKIIREIEITPSVLWEESEANKASNSMEAILCLYKYLFPEWDDIEKIEGWPQVTPEFNKQMFSYFIDLDRETNKFRSYSEQIFPGGIWMNNGFGIINPPEKENTIKIDLTVQMREREEKVNDDIL